VLFAFILLYFFDLLSLQRQHPLPWSESKLTIPSERGPGKYYVGPVGAVSQ